MRLAAVTLAVLALVAAGCRPRTPTSVEIDPALARLVPADTVALIGVNVGALRATPLYQKYIARQLAAQWDKLPKQEGFDPRKDVSELLVASGRTSAAMFAKSKSSVFQAGFGVVQKGAKGGVPAVLREKLRSIPPQNQIWAVGIGSVPLVENAIPKQGNFANLRNLVSSVESWTAGLDLRSGLKMEVNGIYHTEADAKMIHDALRGLVGLGRLSTPDNAPELLRFYDGIQITQQKNAVRVSADIPADALDKFMERLGRIQQ